MKKSFLALSALLSFQVMAFELQVTRLSKEPRMERSFVLSTNIPETVILDCQSFVQGLRIGERASADLYLLDPQECEDLYKRINGSIKRKLKHCIDIGADIRSDYSCS
jgi:hypothetical protein